MEFTIFVVGCLLQWGRNFLWEKDEGGETMDCWKKWESAKRYMLSDYKISNRRPSQTGMLRLANMVRLQIGPSDDIFLSNQCSAVVYITFSVSC